MQKNNGDNLLYSILWYGGSEWRLVNLAHDRIYTESFPIQLTAAREDDDLFTFVGQLAIKARTTCAICNERGSAELT